MTIKPHPVLVTWIDSAYLAPGWHDVDNARDFTPAKCLSVGFRSHRGRSAASSSFRDAP